MKKKKITIKVSNMTEKVNSTEKFHEIFAMGRVNALYLTIVTSVI
jgi:hypothetical protein